MPDTKYDRFYVEELVKKYPKLEDLQAFLEKIHQISAATPDQFIEEFLAVVESGDKAEEEKREKLAKQQEEAKLQQQTSKLKDWSQEDEA